ncbi:hypothetical protein DMA12_14540 [Amycolatopsis balhimycina DSM 5908]|uniref:Proteinase inhibitor I36 SMPI n=1 Tax=Amycolatopsis balhimycina DSM 5908 TaxID=1081091 RepID=A0A428WQ79_AMYBA|nr:hypothetical protein DMA12_14540 [Amycolatopsis balhimycina DSM 5908]
MRSGTFRTLFVLAAVAVSSTTAVTPASAHAPRCSPHVLCAWTGSIFSGSRAEFPVPDNSCVNISGPRYSAYNRMSVSLALSEGTCGSGARAWYIAAGEQQPYLLPNGAKSASRCSACRAAARP